jgi:hypothetical protein
MRKDCCNCLKAVHMLCRIRIRKERGVTLRQMGSTSSGLSLVSTLEPNDRARASSVCSAHHATLGPGWKFNIEPQLRVRSEPSAEVQGMRWRPAQISFEGQVQVGPTGRRGPPLRTTGTSCRVRGVPVAACGCGFSHGPAY